MAKARPRGRAKAAKPRAKRRRPKAAVQGRLGLARRGEIIRVAQLPAYTPPGHSGTTNVRLVDGRFNGRFELVLGRLEPGGLADRHSHAREAQVIYLRAGQARVTLGSDPPQLCGPETVIRIPPGVDHEVMSLGPETLELIIVYSPPLSQARSQFAARQPKLVAGERAGKSRNAIVPAAHSGDSQQKSRTVR